MGYYIQGPANGKARYIVEKFDAKVVTKDEARQAMQEGKGVVVVIDNIAFDAAGYCYSEREFEDFAFPDGRNKVYLVMDRVLAEQLSGYKR